MRNYREINGLSELVHDYDTFLVDAWGVLHDGGSAFKAAQECLCKLKQQGKTVIILSNAARRTTDFEKELLASGVNKQLYDFSVSSGELVWTNFSKGEYETLGKRCFYLGPERSRGILENLDIIWVNSLAEAQVIINTGAEGNLPDALSFKSQLEEAVLLKLPMICANPDKVAIRKGIRGISAGAIADYYQQLGGHVLYVGKPYQQIFTAAVQQLKSPSKERVLMIGDGLQTDILGANQFGIDALFISGGIYAQQIKHLNDKDALMHLFKTEGGMPNYVLSQLKYA